MNPTTFSKSRTKRTNSNLANNLDFTLTNLEIKFFLSNRDSDGGRPVSISHYPRWSKAINHPILIRSIAITHARSRSISTTLLSGLGLLSIGKWRWSDHPTTDRIEPSGLIKQTILGSNFRVQWSSVSLTVGSIFILTFDFLVGK